MANFIPSQLHYSPPTSHRTQNHSRLLLISTFLALPTLRPFCTCSLNALLTSNLDQTFIRDSNRLAPPIASLTAPSFQPCLQLWSHLTCNLGRYKFLPSIACNLADDFPKNNCLHGTLSLQSLKSFTRLKNLESCSLLLASVFTVAVFTTIIIYCPSGIRSVATLFPSFLYPPVTQLWSWLHLPVTLQHVCLHSSIKQLCLHLSRDIACCLLQHHLHFLLQLWPLLTYNLAQSSFLL